MLQTYSRHVLVLLPDCLTGRFSSLVFRSGSTNGKKCQPELDLYCGDYSTVWHDTCSNQQHMNRKMERIRILHYLILLCLLLAACSHLPPDNVLPAERYYMPQRESPRQQQRDYQARLADNSRYIAPEQPYQRYSTAEYNAPLDLSQTTPAPARALPAGIPLAPGDRVRVSIVEGEEFNGDYVINRDGTLRLPYLRPLPIAGLDLTRAEQALARALVEEGMFRAHFVQVSLLNLLWAPVKVQVAGAVFQPGQVQINNRSAEDIAQQLTAASGDYAPDRSLTAALQAAGGIRPDADVSHITLLRQGQRWQVDLSGILTGNPVPDIALTANDTIEVPSSGRFHPELVRPSAITPPGMRVFISNLSVPADSNAQASVNEEGTRLPYGTQLLQATVGANCVGGSSSVNSSRYVVLASYNPLTRRSEVIERNIERLVRDAGRDEFNPYLLPGDALACYDSQASDLRDIARMVTDILLPLTLLKTLR